MATMLDLRRTDLRSNVLTNPYWITSASIEKEADDKGAGLFSFPITKSVAPGYGNGLILIQQVAVEVVTAFAGGTVALTIGQGSLATDAVTTAGTITDVDADMYCLNADLTLGTPGIYMPTTGNASPWLTDAKVLTFTTDWTITPVDTTVLTVAAYLTSSGVITAGAARVHLLISEVPAVR